MPTVMTHAVVGLTAGAWVPLATRRRWFWILSAALPMLPDLDVLGLSLGVPVLSMWGHRGITHSLAAATVIGVLAAAVAHRRLAVPPLRLALYFTLVTASHGVLDAFTNGGVGVAFFAPFDGTRYFFRWRPLPVSPLGIRFFSGWGWDVFRREVELVWLSAALLVAAAALVQRGWRR